MQNPLFSILIAQYNNGHFFNDCYQSILNQTYQNWEVIIVDDGSTDDSLTIIKQIIGDDSRFKLFLNNENKGCGYTKHKCASLATGEILGYVDPDDALKMDAIQKMVVAHIKSEEIAIITSKFELVDLEMKFLSIGKQGHNIAEGKSYLTDTQGILTAFATFKKVKYNASIGIDSKMKRAVDQDLYYKLEEQGSHVFINEALYLYRINDNSISANDNVYKARYWHFYAMIAAYERRRKLNLKTPNFTKLQVKVIKSNYFISRLKLAELKNKKCEKYYFLFKSLVAYPRHNIKYKIKSLFSI